VRTRPRLGDPATTCIFALPVLLHPVWEDSPPSVSVVTFNRKQADAIEDALEDRAEKRCDVLLQVRALGSSAEARDATRECDRETIWCGEFDCLNALVAKAGGNAAMEFARPVSQFPLKIASDPGVSHKTEVAERSYRSLPTSRPNWQFARSHATNLREMMSQTPTKVAQPEVSHLHIREPLRQLP